MPIADIKKEYEELLEQLGSPELISNWEKFQELSARKKELEKIIEIDEEITNVKNEIEANKGILASKEDDELSSLAQTELTILLEREKKLENTLADLLNNKGAEKDSPEAVIVEIRAGTGGEEAAIFAADLFKMYSKFAASSAWPQKILDSNPTELGGFKEIIFELKSREVWQKMKLEAGVHRVQRIPTTEKSGRIHTSTASVAVLPKPKKSDTNIKPSDLKIDVYKSSGPGGQYVNKRETAVRITHLPTGLVVASQAERNLLQNKENALSILAARLRDSQEKKEMEKLGSARRTQIGKAKRVEKIRTYNFPQDRITDHRIKKSWHNIEKIMSGELAPVIQDLVNSPDL